MPKQGFISWSGDESREVAEQLQKLFAHTLAAPKLFVASKDLKAGEVWFTEIAQRLEDCDVGVIVVTKQNLAKPWLHFEAGAIAKRVGRSAAIPLLCGVSTGELSGTPLAQLQAITTSESDVRKLCFRLNELLELELTDDHINESFPVWWDKLKIGIDNPEIWQGQKQPKAQPTIADLSVQVTQLAASVAGIADSLSRQNAGLLIHDREYASRLASWVKRGDNRGPELRIDTAKFGPRVFVDSKGVLHFGPDPTFDNDEDDEEDLRPTDKPKGSK